MNPDVNLVPESFHRRLLLRRRLRQWTLVWILSIVAVVLSGVSEYRGLDNQRKLVTQLENCMAPLQQAEVESRQLRQELLQISSRESLLTQLERWDHPAQLIGIIGQAAYGEQFDVHLSEIHLTPIHGHVTREVTLENGQRQMLVEPVDRMQLRMTGLGVDDLAVSRFVLDLRSGEWFDTVKLQSSTDVPWMAAEAHEFHVECEYQ